MTRTTADLVRSSAAEYLAFVSAINQHLRRLFADQELVEERVIEPHLTTAADGQAAP